jgi:solute carrier family 8 (sodium/calcium exchanger)
VIAVTDVFNPRTQPNKFAIVPPTKYCGGWACFFGALTIIGVVTWVVSEFANLFGCVLGLKTSVTAITVVALGTSLPDTFASMIAAVQDPNADPALGNVTGSNAVRVFMGLGVPWIIAAHYDIKHYGDRDDFIGYYVPAGALGFSVGLFTVLACTCIAFLIGRRYVVGGELGGSKFGRNMSCAFLCGLWTIYIIASTLQAYGLLGDVSLGIDKTMVHREAKCWTSSQEAFLKDNNLFDAKTKISKCIK